MTNNPSFIHFGCWNQGVCPGNRFEQVLNLINSNISRLTPQFLVVAGDNYYPDKTIESNIKEKTANLQTLISGFQCLHRINIDDKIVLIGNHDVVPDSELTRIVDINNVTIEIVNKAVHKNDCSILETEQKIHGLINTGIRELSENTLVIFIDTSLYEDNSDESQPCYNTIYGNKSIYTLMEEQHKFVREKVQSSTAKNVIIIGHHPFTGLKKKKAADINITYPQHHPPFANLLFDAFSCRSGTNNYYLCADLHLYQYNEITMAVNDELDKDKPAPVKFIQHIAGIGGTKLDELPVDNNNVDARNFSTGIYNISYTAFPSIKNHGYLSIEEKNTEIFIRPNFITLSGGGPRKKTRRKRNKQRKYTKKRTKSKYNKRKLSR